MFREYTTLLSNKSFLHLWSSQILSQITISVLNFLLLIRLYNHTGSSVATSLLWVSYALPAILVGPIAAAVVDNIDNRKVLITTNLLQSLTILLYALAQKESEYILYGVVMTYSFFNQFYVPAELSTLPSVVKKNNLAQANGLFFITQQGSIVFGIGLAGLILNTIGFFYSLILCAILLLMAFITVRFLPAQNIRFNLNVGIEEKFIRFFKQIFEGYLFIKRNNIILGPILILIGIQVTLTVMAVNIPAIASDIFKINVELAGIFIVVPAGIGAAIGAVTVPRLLRKGYRKIKIISYSLLSLSLSLVVIDFIVPDIKILFSLIISFVFLIIMGLSFIAILISSQTFLQEKTPGGLRGRVFGNFWFLVSIATLFPVILSGTIVELFGIRFLIFILISLLFSLSLYMKKYGSNFINTNNNVSLNNR